MNTQSPIMTAEQIDNLPYRPCVGVVLANPRGHVFVGSRLDRDSDAWQMPQGGVDPGETCLAAAKRELWEETGIAERLISVEAETKGLIRYDLPDHLIGRVWGGKYRGQEQKWFLFRFHGDDADVNIATGHPEFSDWKWVPQDEVIAQIVPFKRDVYAQVFAELGARL